MPARTKPSSPPSAFIAGIHGDDGTSGTCRDATTKWTTSSTSCDAVTTARSVIPPGLTNGTNALAIFPSETWRIHQMLFLNLIRFPFYSSINSKADSNASFNSSLSGS